MKVQAKSFHLNGHIIGFRSQTRKFKLPYKTPSNTLAVKGLDETELFGRTLGSARVVEYLRSGADYLPPGSVVSVFFATLRDTGLPALVAVASGAGLSCYEYSSFHFVYCCLFPLSLIITIKTKIVLSSSFNNKRE